jgi:hypothetical protein
MKFTMLEKTWNGLRCNYANLITSLIFGTDTETGLAQKTVDHGF